LETASNDSGVIENTDFHGFRRYVFSTLRNETNFIMYYYLIPSRLAFPLTPKYITLADSKWLECSLYVTVLRFSILHSVIFFFLIYCRVCLRSGIGETLHLRNVNNYRRNYDIVLVLHCISTDSKHCLIEICAKFCFAPICLKLWSPGFRSFSTVKFIHGEL